MPAIDILLPTYNGARWLDELMESFERQDFCDWRLIVRDDGSSDDTPTMLANWKARLRERMVVLTDDRGNVGLVEGVNILTAASEAPWIMLADQDDVWLDWKVSRMAAEMQKAEADHGSETPIAIYSDAVVVDAELRPMHRSWWSSVWMLPRNTVQARPPTGNAVLDLWTRLWFPQPARPSEVAMESPVLGCAMIYNRRLAELAAPIPQAAYFHDWWLALAAASFGMLLTIEQATVLFRRHGANLSSSSPGATHLGDALFGAITKTRATRANIRAELIKTSRQAHAFSLRFGEKLPPREAAAMRALGSLPTEKGLTTRLIMIRYGLLYSTAARNTRVMALL